MTRKRTLKKMKHRGRIATPKARFPDVMQPGDTEWLPGQPAFHAGTDNGRHHAFMNPEELNIHRASNPSGGGPQEGAVRWVPAPGLPGFVIQEEFFNGQWVPVRGQSPTRVSTGGAGSPGTDPAQEQFLNRLRERAAELAEDQLQLDRDIADNRIESDQAINTQNVIAAQRIEEERRFMEALQLQYTQRRDNLDREFQQFQANVGVRGQDIGQRATDIAALLDRSGQQLS